MPNDHKNKHDITVTVRTPAGLGDEFELKDHDRVDKTTKTAVDHFVAKNQLAPGNLPVLEIAVAFQTPAPPSGLDVGAGVAECPYPLAVEPFETVRHVDPSLPPALHPQPKGMVVTGDDLDEGRRPSTEVPIAMLQRQALVEPHSSFSQGLEEQPVSQRTRCPCPARSAVVKDRSDLFGPEHRRPLMTLANPNDRDAHFPAVLEVGQNPSTWPSPTSGDLVEVLRDGDAAERLVEAVEGNDRCKSCGERRFGRGPVGLAVAHPGKKGGHVAEANRLPIELIEVEELPPERQTPGVAADGIGRGVGAEVFKP